MARIDYVPGEWLFAREVPRWKRTFDIVGSVSLLLLFGPAMVAIAIAIKLTSPGPIVFRQVRAGGGMRPFTFYKFRTMVTNAEELQHELMEHNQREGPVFKMKNDPRITRFGAFLRKWSLDEFPQFLNVLKGDMSLVGPRPLPFSEAQRQDSWHNRRLDIRPGVTCLWQVFARHDPSFERWVRLDIEYAQNQSLLHDIKILLRTIPAVLSQRGAQ